MAIKISKANTTLIGYAVVLTVIGSTILAIIYVYTAQKNILFPNQRVTRAPAPTPKPKNLPAGKQVYQFSHGDGVSGPKLGEVIIDPLDAAPNQMQTVTATIRNDTPVTAAVATVLTDHDQTEYPLTQTTGSLTDGTWEGSWSITDSYLWTYGIHFRLESPSGSWQGDLTFR